MKRLINWINSLKGRKEIDTNKLPSQGYFYEPDFKIWIKKVEVVDILEYEKQYVNDIAVALQLIKAIVKKYTILSKKYTFENIKSIDIIFIFLEIVRFTNGKTMKIEYYNDITGKTEFVEFGVNSFNYFNVPKQSKECFDKKTKEFVVDGYKYSIPSIGVETSLTQFLIEKSWSPDVEKYNSYEYNFMYFLGNKHTLTFSEIDNLIEIFNNDIDDVEKEKINKIVEQFRGFSKYLLKDNNNKLVEINNKLDLSTVWKS